MVFHRNALMCIKKVKLFNHDCLPILVLLYILLYIVLAYLMMFAALSNAVCLYNASFLPLICANAFHFHALSWLIDTVCLFHALICVMHSPFTQLVFPNSLFTP